MSDYAIFLVPTDRSAHNAKVHIRRKGAQSQSLCKRADRKDAYRSEEHPFNQGGDLSMCVACADKLVKIFEWLGKEPR